ncbi:hypothetical protein [Frigoriglobus tundricola]|uniref:Uncharacterized protein n=1 Tax=Frigoriglobus tundricola TaxID=2774151 RepID=A0A6M5Z1R3_9BACT|nr:hypothetical protein [Frigoriglobus tundricola]QJX00099.1 hypothetical protein FTUN_7723 [Frigoriglobus tundricola]
MLRLVLLAAVLAGLTGCGSATSTSAPHKDDKKTGSPEKKHETEKPHDTEKPHATKK